MKVVRTGLGLILVILLLVGSTGAVLAKEDGRFLIGTWNMELLPWEEGQATATARINKVPTNFHVLGLVEVWSQKHADTIRKKYAKAYPFSYYVPAKQGANIGAQASNPYCPYLGLPEADCGATLGYGEINCLQAFGISTHTLLPSLVPAGPCRDIHDALLATDALAAACLVNELHLLPDGDAAYQAVGVCAAGQGHTYDFGGSPGLLLLSKHPILNVRLRDMVSFHTRKVILSAEVNRIRLAFSNFPYDLEIPAPFPPPVFDLQTAFARAIVDARVDVAFGSFNSGPEYQPDAFNFFLGSKYHMLSEIDTFCTAEIAPSHPRCAGQVPLDIDHLFIDVMKWPALPLLLTVVRFNNVPGLSSHAGIGLKFGR